ncbi:MAG TPA: exo-alpha-sialidase, partial [Kofleriaceae bacterium]
QQLHAEPSSFGFPVAVHPREPDTAWFIPAHSDQKRTPITGEIVVNRTRDGGKTFQTLREGLPQQHAYDLVFRHALAIADDGDQLAFGSSTGNLWMTANQGDAWHAVAHHLPPIYAVRYA